jgi:hypothetical protein
MQPNQKLILISDASDYGKPVTQSIKDTDYELKDRADYYFSRALNDSRIYGIVPFHYSGYPGGNIDGLISLPNSKIRYNEIGKAIVSQ